MALKRGSATIAILAGLIAMSGVLDADFRKKIPKPAEFVQGEVLIKFKAALPDAARTAALSTGHVRLTDVGRNGLTRVKLGEADTVESVVAAYALRADVEFAQPNYIYRASANLPNDPEFANQWALKNTAQTIAGASYAANNPGTAGADMDLPKAWDLLSDCSSVIVAVVDTGINYNHLDLVQNMWNGAGEGVLNHGYDFIGATNDPMDKNGHGTHVAGTIGAVGNNATGTAGVCWRVKLMAVRVLDNLGAGTTSSIVAGLNFAVLHHAKVINMSFGGGSFDPAFYAAVVNVQASGVVIVVAAGNSAADNGITDTFPCNYTGAGIVCVAALDQKFALAAFSNYGVENVHVAAPGTNIRSGWSGSQTSVMDDFTGWTFATTTSGGWAHVSKNIPDCGVNCDMLVNPPTWNGSSALYNSGTTDTAHKTFAINPLADAVIASAYVFANVEPAFDFFSVQYTAGAGNPLLPGGLQILRFSGSTGGVASFVAFNLSGCAGQSVCSLGVQLTSDASVSYPGVGLLKLKLTTLVLNNTSYNTIDGSSMASPHAAGLAALLFAFNPAYQAADVVDAIKSGGTVVSALLNKTSTGKAVNAYGSLVYIAAPRGVTLD